MKSGKYAAFSRAARLALMQGVLVAGAQAAFAAAPQLPSEDGLLILPNVRVERSAQPVDTARPVSTSNAGMRAFRDPETGKLRKPTAEDLLADAQVTPALNNNAAAARFTARGNARATALLDESFMSYAVVGRGADGALDMQCVVGEERARKALATGTNGKERRHAH